MNSLQKRMVIPFVQAIDVLMRLYRQRLVDDPAIVAAEWGEHVDPDAIVDFQDGSFVLLVEE